MRVRPVTRDAANEVVSRWHSHHKAVRSHRYALGAYVDDPDEIVGVVIVGNPIAAALNDRGTVMEVLRLCTNGHRNAASFLLGASWRVAKEMGVRRLVSYTRQDEPGTCYRAAGWDRVADVVGRPWSGPSGRTHSQVLLPGVICPTTEIVDRHRWEIAA